MNELPRYINEKKKIYELLLIFLDSPNNEQNNFLSLINIIIKLKIHENGELLENFLRLVSCICSNRQRKSNLIPKTLQIIQYFQDQIKQTLSNISIYKIFEDDRLLLLHLIENGLITFDLDVFRDMATYKAPNCHFFKPEIQKVTEGIELTDFERQFVSETAVSDDFEEKRHRGENDSYLCEVIRSDMIHEFIRYTSQKKIPLSRSIERSIFESNNFLNENDPTLIQYACFFGSLKVANYLLQRKVEVEPSLMVYAVHSRSAAMLHFVEENCTETTISLFNECVSEGIKCHHNEIACYFINNYLFENDEAVVCSALKHHNYEFFPDDFSKNNGFFYLCSNNYSEIVDLYIKMKEEEIKKEIIKTKKQF
ncbi:hypothetical protein M9Y10_031041 [Tritrichomonas musculus]|uniref:DUF3447 domain-containing protein n=1 Tax=Tritrichomonas musculus TaxID=1915356 RepID=A0ABR2H1M4_9EUKA